MAEYINREELFKDIEDSVRFSTRNGVSAELRGAHKITDRIRSAPSADVVEVVHGKWVAVEYNDGSVFKECSNCGARKQQIYYNFCSNCGAKMDGKGG